MSVWEIICSFGLPSAIVGIFVWYIKKRFDAMDKKRTEESKNLTDMCVLLIESNGAAIALSEATAVSVEQGKCNGELKAAREYAATVKHKQKDLITRLGVKSLF